MTAKVIRMRESRLLDDGCKGGGEHCYFELLSLLEKAGFLLSPESVRFCCCHARYSLPRGVVSRVPGNSGTPNQDFNIDCIFESVTSMEFLDVTVQLVICSM